MIRATSIKAYNELQFEGRKQTQEQKIIEVLKQKEMPLSLTEISSLTGFKINAVSGRVNELKKKGKLIEGKKRKCFITKRTITPVIAL